MSNPEIKYLISTIHSVREQTYPNWELCISCVEPRCGEIQQILDEFTKADSRIKVIYLEMNLGPAGNTNAAIGISSGKFIAFLEQGDCLAPFALFEVVRALNQYPNTDMLYSDEDLMSEDEKHRFSPAFKPAFSIDYLRGFNYISHLLVLRKGVGDRLGWLREGFESAQDHDLILRAVEQATKVTHIPKILYHKRVLKTSTDKKIPLIENPKVKLAGLKAIQEHLIRCDLQAIVQQGREPFIYHVKYKISDRVLVSIVIPNHDHTAELRECVESILTYTSYPDYEIIIIENNSQKPETAALYRELQLRDKRIRVANYDKTPFNYSEINNYATKIARGGVFVFLNNDTQVISPDWLEGMLEYAIRPDIGAVGVRLIYPANLIQHAGIVVGMGVGARHFFVGYPNDDPGYRFNLWLPQNLSAVTAACVMIRRTVFEGTGGFGEEFRLAYGDIDMCLKVRKKNYLVVCTPYVELIHHESITRGFEDTREKESRFLSEAKLLMEKWPELFALGDPYYNPNLTLTRGDFSVRKGICNQEPRSMNGLLFNKKTLQ